MLNYSVKTGGQSIPVPTVVRKLRDSPNLMICLGNLLYS